MALVVGFSTSGIGVRYDLGTTDDLIMTASTSYIISTDSTAIRGVGSGHSVTLLGNVYGPSGGVTLGDDTTNDSGNRVTIAETGIVGGSYGVRVRGANSVVLNHGEISGEIYGVIIGGDGVGESSVVNTGLISGGIEGITRYTPTNEALRVTNLGTIIAPQAFEDNNSDAVDIFVNRGRVVGDIDLGAGNDLYDGRGGTIEGEVLGGDGNDRFIGGSGVDVFDGGAGIDTLDFRKASVVRVALNGQFAPSGAAAGDEYAGFEVLWGTFLGNDILTGSTAANGLSGFGGNDTLAGGGGGDGLNGGLGTDRMSGGAGNDRFIFNAAREGGDIITDFSSSAVGNNDRFEISAAGFGGGLVAGPLPIGQFRSQASNVAQDADDRFIFRTTDTTLWFDVNGNAAGGLTMIADLQAGAVVTAADIVLV
jgi:Ca2+-binding RTX toxin-like protein